MKTLQEYGEKHPKVKKWLSEAFRDDGTRNVYGWHLKAVCNDLKVQPEQLLKLANNGPSPLYLKIKHHLVALSNDGKSRKSSEMKSAISNFVDHYNEHPSKFKLNVPIQVQSKWERPYWTLNEWEQVLDQINYKYQRLFKIGVMCGFGRMELVYLNQHLNEIKPVPEVPEAYYLEMQGRKSNTRKWKAILPAKEIQELKGPMKTTWGGLIGQFNLTEQFNRATKRANMRVKGTGVHVMRSIFRTVGGNAGIDEKILEQQMGHFDKYHYDRSHEDLPRRANALIPLWDYFRTGPPVATSKEVDTLAEENKQLKEEYARAKEEIARLKEVVPKLQEVVPKLQLANLRLEQFEKKVAGLESAVFHPTGAGIRLETFEKGKRVESVTRTVGTVSDDDMTPVPEGKLRLKVSSARFPPTVLKDGKFLGSYLLDETDSVQRRDQLHSIQKQLSLSELHRMIKERKAQSDKANRSNHRDKRKG